MESFAKYLIGLIDNGINQRDTVWNLEPGMGLFLSNTYNLIKNRGYHAVLIEANHGKFDTLCKNIPQNTVTKVKKLFCLPRKWNSL